MPRRIAVGFLTCVAVTVAVAAGLWMVGESKGPAQASDGVLTMGVDADPSGNSATSLDVFDTCRGVTAGDTFEIDIYVTEVDDLLSWEAYLRYNKNLLRVDDHSLPLQEEHSSQISDTSDATPDTDGLFRVGGIDMSANTPGSGASGDGVLARITLYAIQDGSSSLSIEPIDLNDDGLLDSFNDIGPWLKNTAGDLANDADGNGFFDGPITSARVGIGGTDSDGDTLPDSCDSDDDNDAVPDVGDNCPTEVNPLQGDRDLDGLGNVCDEDEDGDGFANDYEIARGSVATNRFSTPEVCDFAPPLSALDEDGDTITNEGFDLNGNGVPDCEDDTVDTDGDTIANPSDDDDDGDGFGDTVENWIDTDSMDSCADTTTRRDELIDKTAPDSDDDCSVTIIDVILFKPSFFSVAGGQDPNWRRRYDIDQSETVDIIDVIKIKPYFFSTCLP